jgi:hypothetical protein
MRDRRLTRAGVVLEYDTHTNRWEVVRPSPEDHACPAWQAAWDKSVKRYSDAQDMRGVPVGSPDWMVRLDYRPSTGLTDWRR